MKYIHELTDSEKRELIESNKTLQNMVYDDMNDNVCDFICEQMEYIIKGCSDYHIAPYTHNYIIVSDAIKFLNGLEKIQKCYCTLSDAMQPEIDRVLAALDRFYFMYIYNNNYDILLNWLEQKAQYFANCIAKYFSDCLDPSRADMIEYFIEFYADERMDESYYIEDGILYQNIIKKIA